MNFNILIERSSTVDCGGLLRISWFLQCLLPATPAAVDDPRCPSFPFTIMQLEISQPEIQRPSRKGKERDLMHRDSPREPQPTDLDEKLIAFRRRTAAYASFSRFWSVLAYPSPILAPVGPGTSLSGPPPHRRRLLVKNVLQGPLPRLPLALHLHRGSTISRLSSPSRAHLRKRIPMTFLVASKYHLRLRVPVRLK